MPVVGSRQVAATAPSSSTTGATGTSEMQQGESVGLGPLPLFAGWPWQQWDDGAGPAGATQDIRAPVHPLSRQQLLPSRKSASAGASNATRDRRVSRPNRMSL